MRAVAIDLFEEERRRCKRVPLATNAFLLPPGSQRRALSALVENISVGGVGIRAPYSVPVGKTVQVLIELDGQPVDTTAIVIRGNPSLGYGLRFINVDRQGMESICRFIAARSEGGAKASNPSQPRSQADPTVVSKRLTPPPLRSRG